jgi:hypothetical protein
MCDCSSVGGSQQSEVQAQIQMAIAVKSQQATKQQGQSVVSLIEAAAKISVSIDDGSKFDAQV